jgi:hypothetical protein
MTEIGTGTAWLLAAVFVWAAVAKLRAPGRTARSFEALQLPLARPLALGVPVLELVVAALLVLAPPVGGAAAVALLAAFTALLALQVRAGSTVACGCFGSAGTEPVGAADLVRNAALLLGAIVAQWGTLAAPSLPAVLTVGAAAAIAAMVHGLVRLKVQLGVVWDNTLPGEPVRP